MKLVVSKKENVVMVSGIPSSVETEDDWLNAFLPFRKTMMEIPHFSVILKFPKLSKLRSAMGEKVFRCLWLVLQGLGMTPDFYPEDPDQVMNVSVAPGVTWKTVPVLRRYINPRLKTVLDPEYLVLLWSKQLENYDENDRALLPTYPKDLYNRPFRPEEIRDVVHQVRFLWSLQREPPEKTQYASPALFALVDDPLGYRVLNTAYAMLESTTSEQKRALLAHFKKENPHTAEWKTGFLFVGMKEPLIRPECLLTEYFLSRFFYLPSPRILDLLGIDAPTQSFLEKMKSYCMLHHRRFYLTAFDLDPKTMKQIYSVQPTWYFDKAQIKKYLQEKKKPNYYLFLEEMMKMFLCKRLS